MCTNLTAPFGIVLGRLANSFVHGPAVINTHTVHTPRLVVRPRRRRRRRRRRIKKSKFFYKIKFLCFLDKGG
jgi:hypothetical protein